MLYTNFSVRPMVLMLVPWESYRNGNFVPNRQEFSYAEIELTNSQELSLYWLIKYTDIEQTN